MNKEKNLNRYDNKIFDRILDSKLTSPVLILGSDNFGKLSLIKNISKRMLCQNHNLDCEICEDCKLIKADNHPDFTIISPKSTGKKIKNKIISISDIKQLIQKSHIASYKGGFRIFVIHQANFITPQAQNILLKILEEPSEKLKIFLTADSEKQILPTIISRCQIIKLKPISRNLLKRELEKFTTSNNISNISRLSEGRIDIALNFLENKKDFQKYQKQVEEAFNLIESENLVLKFNQISKIIQKNQTDQFCHILLLIFRDILYFKLGTGDSIIFINKQEQIQELAKKLSKNKIINIIKEILETQNKFKQNINPKLALENLILSFR